MRAVFIVALLNFGYFFIESGVAVSTKSVSLFADSVDFLEDASLNLLILLGASWSLRKRANLGMVLAGILLVPSAFTLITAYGKFTHTSPPDAASLGLVGLGALVVNLGCAATLVRFRHHKGSLTQAAFLSARNDVMANIAIILTGLVTHFFVSGWPDLIVGLAIMAMNADAAVKVFRAAHSERKLALEEASS